MIYEISETVLVFIKEIMFLSLLDIVLQTFELWDLLHLHPVRKQVTEIKKRPDGACGNSEKE